MRYTTADPGQWKRYFALIPTRVGTLNGRFVWVWLDFYEVCEGFEGRADHFVHRSIHPEPGEEPYHYRFFTG